MTAELLAETEVLGSSDSGTALGADNREEIT